MRADMNQEHNNPDLDWVECKFQLGPGELRSSCEGIPSTFFDKEHENSHILIPYKVNDFEKLTMWSS